VAATSNAPVAVTEATKPAPRPWWASRHVAVGVGAAAALLVFLAVVVATSWPDATARPDAERPLRVRTLRVIRKADLSEESSREGADTSADRKAPSPRVVILPAPPPPPSPQPRAQKHDHVAGGPASPPSVETPPPPAPPAPPKTDVPPTGGHAPLRPIVTSNPYGGS
jgi:hypothetical protein